MKMKNIWVLLVWSLCQTLLSSSPVTALDTSFCVFPFIFKGNRYTSCTRAGDPNGELWCSTKIDSQGNHIKKNWRQCTNCLTYPDNGSGKCVRVQQCESLNEVYERVIGGKSDTGLDFLRKSECGYEDQRILVCCPRSTKPLCGGAVNSDRIVGGVNAALGAWPWMVLFLLREKRSYCTSNNCLGAPFWACGGVLINDRYVLSAAHCFKNKHIDFARIGEYNLKTNIDENSLLTAPQPQDIDVEKIIQHPSYGSPCSKCNDIALAKLQRSATLHPTFVQPICLPPTRTERVRGLSESEIQNRIATVTGWGVTDRNNPLYGEQADILQQANLTIQELQFCRDRKTSYRNLQRSILCAGQGDGKDICRGDSGGPLMLAEDGGVHWYVVGISSFGATACGSSDAQGVFTSVHYYLDWIKRNSS